MRALKRPKGFERNKKEKEMIVVYVGDSKDVVRRILTDHCSGNVTHRDTTNFINSNGR